MGVGGPLDGSAHDIITGHGGRGDEIVARWSLGASDMGGEARGWLDHHASGIGFLAALSGPGTGTDPQFAGGSGSGDAGADRAPIRDAARPVGFGPLTGAIADDDDGSGSQTFRATLANGISQSLFGVDRPRPEFDGPNFVLAATGGVSGSALTGHQPLHGLGSGTGLKALLSGFGPGIGAGTLPLAARPFEAVDGIADQAVRAASVNRTSPTSFGAVPDAVTEIGGVVLDLVGQSGTRVVAQLSASSLYEGFFAGSVGTIGTLGGITEELVGALGGGIAEVAVRLTVYDGDTASGNFDRNQNWLDLNGVRIQNFTDVLTYRTDSVGTVISGPRNGFGNNTLDTGWFYNADAATLAALFAELESIAAGGTGLAFQLVDSDPSDNFFDFTRGVDGGLIDVGSLNIVPTANDDTFNVSEDDGATALDVRANDVDTDPFDVTEVAGTAMPGTVILVSGAELGLDGDGNVLFTQNDAYAFLNPGETVTEIVTYEVADTQNATDTATLTIVIAGANDAPQAVDDSFVTDETAAGLTGALFADNGGPLGADFDVDRDASFQIVRVNGSAANVGTQVALGAGLVTVGADGSMAFVVDGRYEFLGFGETATETFTYVLDDGIAASAEATVTIRIDGENDRPEAFDDAFVLTEDDAALSGDLTADNGAGADFDRDANDVLAVTAIDGDPAGVEQQIALGEGLLTVGADGTFSFVQGSAYAGLRSGEQVDLGFVYTVADPQGLTSEASVRITVEGRNDAPELRDDVLSVDENAASVGGNVFADNGNGIDSDADAGAGFRITAIDGQSTSVGTEISLGNGLLTVGADGALLFRPNGGYEALPQGGQAVESFTYTVTDDDGLTATATATITVAGRNDPPRAVDDGIQTLSTRSVTFDPRFNDIDAENLPLSFVSIAGAAPGIGVATALPGGASVRLNADGTLTYDPAGAFVLAKDAVAVDSLAYTIADSAGETSSATVTVRVVGPNTAPVAVADDVTVPEDGQVTIDVLANDTDADAADTLDTLLVAGPAHGNLAAGGDGTFTYVPFADFNGTDSFTYAATDGTDGTTATVTITVTPEPDVPDARDDVATAEHDTAVTIDVLTNDTDADGDGVAIVGVGTARDGSVGFDGASVTYTPLAGFVGSDTFSYTIEDVTGRRDTATVTVTVAPGPVPNLVVTGAAMPGGEGGSFVQASWTLANTGAATLTDSVIERLWLSTDDALDSGDIYLRALSFSGDLDPGESIGRSARVTLPDVPGQYRLIVTVDDDNVILENNDLDNRDVSDPVAVLADYFAVITDAPGEAVSGEGFTVSGRAFDAATGLGEAYEFVTVDLVSDGFRRSFDAFTDADGIFAIEVATLPGNAGRVQLNARNPDVVDEDAASEAELSVFGMQFASGSVSTALIEGESVQISLMLENLSDLGLTGLGASILGVAEGLDVQIVAPLPDDLAGNASETVVLSISADADTALADDSFTVEIGSDQGAVATAALLVDIIEQQPRLVVTDGNLIAGMLLGEQTLVSVEITNLGGATAEDIEVLLPTGLDVVGLVSSAIPDLDPGQSTDITFSLTPDADLPPAQFEGSLVVSSVGASVTVPFEFTTVSGRTGDLDVSLVSERTFLTEEGLQVDDATVTVRDYFTNALVATATDVDGVAGFDDLPAGFYRVEARADGHDSTFATVEVLPGRTVELQSFMSEQTVSYSWTVEEIQFEDRYVVEVESTFTTNVPQPVVVLEPAVIDVFELDAIGDEMTIDLTLTNHGLITAENLQLNLGSHPWYRIEPLIDGLDALDARSSVTIPVRIVRTGDETTAAAGGPAPDGGLIPLGAAGQPMAMSAPLDAPGGIVPCIINGLLSYEFPCGGFTVGKALGISYANVDGNCSLPFTFGGGGGSFGGGGGVGSPVFSYVPAFSITDLCDLLRVVFDCASLLPLPPMLSAALTAADFLLFGTGLEPEDGPMPAGASPEAGPLDARGLKQGLNALDDLDDLLDQVIPILDTASQAGACARAVGDFLGNETLSEVGEGVQDVVDAVSDPLNRLNDVIDPLDDLLEGDNPFTEPNDAPAPVAAGATHSAEFEAAFQTVKQAYREFVALGAALDDGSDALASVDVLRALRNGLQDLIDTGELTAGQTAAFEEAIGSLRDMLFAIDQLEGTYTDTLAAIAEVELLTDLGDVFLGGQIWMDTLDDPRVQTFLSDFFDAMRASFGEPDLLTTAQRADLLARDLPEEITEGDIEALFATWFDRLTEAGNGDPANRVLQDGAELQRLLGEIAVAEQAALAAGYASLQDSINARLTTADDTANGLNSFEDGGACAQVRLRLEQDVALTRQGFRGTLIIDNFAPEALTDIEVALEIRDDRGSLVAADVFGVFDPVLSGITAIDGSGVIAAGQEGSVEFTILPSRLAAPVGPAGYTIGGTLSYRENGVTVSAELSREPVTVLPQPELQLDYFQSRDVFADDPFTTEIEPSVPFSLGLRVANVGPGEATDLSITSAQPEIIENEKGLLIDFQVIGTEIDGAPIAPTLLADLGDLGAGETATAVWKMQSSLQGVFSDYSASFEHVNGLGIEELSLITDVTIHELVQVVEAGPPGAGDGLPDFLVNGEADAQSLPDRVYFSEGGDAPVVIGLGAGLGLQGALHAVSVQSVGGWTYARLDDTLPTGARIAAVYRVGPDGGGGGETLTEIPAANVWRTDRTFTEAGVAVYENRLHLFDHVDGAGTVEYRIALENAVPGFASPVTAYAVEGQAGAFHTALAADPDGDPVAYDLAGEDAVLFEIDRDSGALTLADGVGFASLGIADGTVRAAQREVQLLASDGIDTAAQTLTVTLLRDTDGDGIQDLGYAAIAGDNAIAVANADQADANGDGYGDVIDFDLDDDGLVGFNDFNLLAGVYDTAADTSGLARAADFDGDGRVGDADYALFLTGFGSAMEGKSWIDLPLA